MNKNDYIIRPETSNDHTHVENLTREAFWNIYRPGCYEHYLIHCLRSDPNFVPKLNLVLETAADGIIGHICFVRAAITANDGRHIPIMTFGPISIAPAHQRQGWGTALLREGMARAKAMGAGALCIEGNINFYGKSGFVLGGSRGIRYHGEPDTLMVPYFLLCELEEGFLDNVEGVYHTPQGYFIDEGMAEEFDRAFPPKVKLTLPGQLV